MKHDIVAIDIFCGAGGLTRGLSEAGIRVVKGIDIDNSVSETYERNNPGSRFVNADIREMSDSDIMHGVDTDGARLLIAGCAPCQPFSPHAAGRKKPDGRQSLIMVLAGMVARIRPKYVLVENVPGFCRDGRNLYHGKLTGTLRGCGYSYDEGVVNAAEYGVPQSRRRYILLASKTGNMRIPDGGYGGGGGPAFKTVRDAISKYPSISVGSVSEKVSNHGAMGMSPLNMERIKAVPKDGGSMKEIPEDMVVRCHRNHPGHTDTYGRMRWDAPAPTLTCRCNSISNGRFGHPEQDRALSLREGAILQSFPPCYEFVAPGRPINLKTVGRMIGNAVPVELARAIARAIKQHLSESGS